ncbi:MAG: DUF933 domain-containing protein [Elusimicrobia bacterium]|nr:DUF933 domain-containing protein [Elusimicrobiota bacterium]
MKIYFSGIELDEGKVKYADTRLEKLAEKFRPKKVVPFFAELSNSKPEQADAIAVTKDELPDIIIPDMDKFERRLARSEDENEKKLVQKCLEILNDEKLLCDEEFSAGEQTILAGLAPLTLKPVIITAKNASANDIISLSLKKAGIIFFYTVGKDECRAWTAGIGSSAITCAGKIHSDLARGFIRADVVSFENMMKAFNWHEAKEKGFVKTVEREHIIRDGDIIEIKFNI